MGSCSLKRCKEREESNGQHPQAMPNEDRASLSGPGVVNAGTMTDASQWAASRLAAMMTAAGTLHFVTPTFFDRIVPPGLPGCARTYTHASGVATYAIAAALAHPRTRRVGGTLAAIFFVAVIPAKVQLTFHWFRDEHTSAAKKVGAIVQLPW